MAEQQQACVMQQRLNPLTGTSEWFVVHDTPSTNDKEVDRKDSLAHTLYLDMLNDSPRNRAFNQAIRKVVKGCDHVLDIGAGTGLLSMMAWRAMNADTDRGVNCSSTEFANDGTLISTTRGNVTGKITACESYLPMARLARKLLQTNGIGLGVRLVHKRSDEMKIGIDLPTPADVLVSEILDSELLGEGLIPTLRHAHTHLLKPSVRTVPHRAIIFGQLVECDFLWRCHDLASVEVDIADGLVIASTKTQRSYHGSSSTMHADALSEQLSLMSQPFRVFEFEFNKIPANRRVCEINVPITKAGHVHALISWWVLQLDEDGAIMYSTAPKWIRTEADGSRWQDHWKQCVWYFPSRVEKDLQGDTLTVTATHDEISVRYKIDSPNMEHPQTRVRESGELDGQDEDSPLHNLAVRPERIGLLGDREYRRVISEALTKAIRANQYPLCLIVDDSVLCVITAALAHANAHIVAMLPGLQYEDPSCIQSMAKANNINFDRIQVIGKKATQLNADHLDGRKVDVFIAEPYYRAYENLLPWQHLRFWYERTTLAPLLADHPTIIPCQGVLCGMAVSLLDLWNARKGLTNVEGFDHTAVNDLLGACGQLSSFSEGPLLPYSLWQCGQCKELTETFSIMTFDFSSPLQSVEGTVKVPVSASGLCHAIVLWMDWILEPTHHLVLSTGPSGMKPSYWKQGIKLLPVPVHLVCGLSEDFVNTADLLQHSTELTISALFSPYTGDIEVDVTAI